MKTEAKGNTPHKVKVPPLATTMMHVQPQSTRHPQALIGSKKFLPSQSCTPSEKLNGSHASLPRHIENQRIFGGSEVISISESQSNQSGEEQEEVVETGVDKKRETERIAEMGES